MLALFPRCERKVHAMELPHTAGCRVVRDAVRLLADMAINAVVKRAMAPLRAWHPLDRITECL
jgi:thiazole synthase ThiGH ThiG subunit